MRALHQKTVRFAPALAVLLACGIIHAAGFTDQPGQFSSADYKFAKAACQGGMAEVILGKVASERSTNTAVQDFGRRMVKDHGRAGENLQRIASVKGAALPAEATADQDKEIDRLSKLSGAEFDRAYMKLMVQYHKAAEREFQRASKKLEDPDLKVFAAETLPVIREHLKMARDLAEGVKAEFSSNN